MGSQCPRAGTCGWVADHCSCFCWPRCRAGDGCTAERVGRARVAAHTAAAAAGAPPGGLGVVEQPEAAAHGVCSCLPARRPCYGGFMQHPTPGPSHRAPASCSCHPCCLLGPPPHPPCGPRPPHSRHQDENVRRKQADLKRKAHAVAEAEAAKQGGKRQRQWWEERPERGEDGEGGYQYEQDDDVEWYRQEVQLPPTLPCMLLPCLLASPWLVLACAGWLAACQPACLQFAGWFPAPCSRRALLVVERQRTLFQHCPACLSLFAGGRRARGHCWPEDPRAWLWRQRARRRQGPWLWRPRWRRQGP